MTKSDITYITATVFAAMTGFFYCCNRWFSIKLPRYFPIEHAWKWAKEPGVPSQGWYSMQAFAFLSAGIVTLLVYLVLKHPAVKKKELKPAIARALGIVATVTVIGCMSYILFYEFDKWGIF